jgi:3-oxoadipate enol-lactonase
MPAMDDDSTKRESSPPGSTRGLDFDTRGDSGSPPLLLLHAGGMTRREWDPFLEALSSRHFLILPTALAHGSSPNRPAINLESLTDSVIDLLDHLSVKLTHILGSSMGGSTALRIALRHPSRVDRLVLYRSGYRAGPAAQAALNRLADPETWRAWGLQGWMEKEHAPQGGPEAWKDVIRKVAVAFGESARAGAAPGLDSLRRMDRPVLLITGDRDEIVPLDDVVAMYKTFPAARLWVVPGAGHVMGMETWRRPAFLSEILRFLDPGRTLD